MKEKAAQQAITEQIKNTTTQQSVTCGSQRETVLFFVSCIVISVYIQSLVEHNAAFYVSLGEMCSAHFASVH